MIGKEFLGAGFQEAQIGRWTARVWWVRFLTGLALLGLASVLVIALAVLDLAGVWLALSITWLIVVLLLGCWLSFVGIYYEWHYYEWLERQAWDGERVDVTEAPPPSSAFGDTLSPSRLSDVLLIAYVWQQEQSRQPWKDTELERGTLWLGSRRVGTLAREDGRTLAKSFTTWGILTGEGKQARTWSGTDWQAIILKEWRA